MKLRLSLFLLVFFVLCAFISCSTTEPECDDCESTVSSSGGGGNSSSGGGGGNSSSDGGDGSSSSDGSGDNSSSSGGNGNSSSGGNSVNLWTGWPFDDSGENLPATPACPSYDEALEIKYNSGGEPTINNSYEESDVSVNKSGENVTVTLSGATERNLVLSGTAQNGSLKVYSEGRVGLYLNGVKITNNSGPAINIQKSTGKGRVNVCLVSGKENYLDGASAARQGEEQAKGAFFSEEKLYFTGNGSLEVKARRGHPESSGHAIVVDNDFEMDNGKIIISEAEGDGIHANDKIEIKGGVIKIASKGDALQSEGGDSILISGGKILAKTTGVKSHGITSESTITIEGNAKVQISVLGNGSKGIKSAYYTDISGGTIAIQASGDRDQNDADTSTAAGIKVGPGDGKRISDLFIKGGNLTIKSPGSKAKGINVSGDIFMESGNVNVEADDDGIKVHGALNMSGGSISVASRKSDEIDAGSKNITGGTINGK